MLAKSLAAAIFGVDPSLGQYRYQCIDFENVMSHDLADLYGVQTKRLNEQVKRNRSRFPPDFMFPLTKSEKDEVVANGEHLQIVES
ncbi:MAG TPA: ORF6N domain-containing protein [Saprospiraceae bacterium]|nr:ORF6N domain-containing protein [Saprospiraceae bacterium]